MSSVYPQTDHSGANVSDICILLRLKQPLEVSSVFRYSHSMDRESVPMTTLPLLLTEYIDAHCFSAKGALGLSRHENLLAFKASFSHHVPRPP